MSAAQENRLNSIQRLGIIAGGGTLPEVLLCACDQKGIEPFVVGFEGQTDPAIVRGRHHLWTRLGAGGEILQTLKSHDIHDLVFAGSIRRPSLFELNPDLRTAGFFVKIGLRAFGDDGLLGAVRRELEEEGFCIHGVHSFADDLLADIGPIGKYEPRKEDWIDIRRGIEASQILGALDIGQSVIVQEGIVLGVEAAEGTDELIARCRFLKRKGRGGVLVKTCKPQQDRDLDLPTIGPDTILRTHESGLEGIVVQAGRTLVIDPAGIAEIADRHKMFVIALDPTTETMDE